jgi:hypothetical protein
LGGDRLFADDADDAAHTISSLLTPVCWP